MHTERRTTKKQRVPTSYSLQGAMDKYGWRDN